MTMKIIRFSQKGLVGNWRFDEGTGSTAKDSSPEGNNGTIHGASWTTGKFGSALKFDGVDDYVDCGNDESLNITDEKTIEIWFNANDLPDWHSIWSKGYVYNDYEISLHIWNNDKVAFRVVKDGIVQVNIFTDVLLTGKWYHVVCTIDNASQIARIYQDGVLKEEDTDFSIPDNLDIPFRIGLRHRVDYFNGTIDEVRIYNRALSAEEIKRHYAFFKYIKPHPIIMRRKL